MSEKKNPRIEIVLHGSLPPKMEDVIRTELPGIQVLCDCNNDAEIKLMLATTLNQLADNTDADLLDLCGDIMTVAMMMRRTPKSVVDLTELLKQRREQK